MSLVFAFARGVVSAVRAVQAEPFQVVRKMRPSVDPTHTVFALGIYIALDLAALGNASRIQFAMLLRETYSASPPIATVSPPFALASSGG